MAIGTFSDISQNMSVRTVADVNRLIIGCLSKIDPETAYVVGVPRSGLLVANAIALHLNLPLLTLDALLSRNLTQEYTRRTGSKHGEIAKSKSKAKVLVVDDSVGTGGTIQKIKQRVNEAGLDDIYRLTYLAAYATKVGSLNVDSFFELLEHPRVFEWNLLHHDYTNSFCVDLDGVLCEDPIGDDNDDGERYLKFLSSARAKVIPSRGIGAIVTSRLEKYRLQTSAWLDQHGIKYKRLIMLNLQSGAERRRLGAHAKFKADVYHVLGGHLFVESESHQAKEIFDLTNKPVYCLTTSTLFS